MPCQNSMMLRFIVCSLLFVVSSGSAFAQKDNVLRDKDSLLRERMHLLNDVGYSASQNPDRNFLRQQDALDKFGIVSLSQIDRRIKEMQRLETRLKQIQDDSSASEESLHIKREMLRFQNEIDQISEQVRVIQLLNQRESEERESEQKQSRESKDNVEWQMNQIFRIHQTSSPSPGSFVLLHVPGHHHIFSRFRIKLFSCVDKPD